MGFEAFFRVASLLRMLHTYAGTSASAQPEFLLVGSHCWCPPGPVPLRTSAPMQTIAHCLPSGPTCRACRPAGAKHLEPAIITGVVLAVRKQSTLYGLANARQCNCLTAAGLIADGPSGNDQCTFKTVSPFRICIRNSPRHYPLWLHSPF